MRITEGTALDAYGRLPYQVDIEDRLPYAVGASAKYSTTNGPAGQVYWEDRNVFGGAEQPAPAGGPLLRAAMVRDVPEPRGLLDQRSRRTAISASFLKPALWGTRNDLLVDALGERVSTGGAGFVGYEAEDVDATVALRHRFSQYLLGSRRASRARRASRPTRSAGSTTRWSAFPLSVNYDTTDSKLDPTRGVRLNASAAGFPTFLGSTLDLAQAQGARLRLLCARRRSALRARPAGSASARWAARRSTRSPPTGASTPAAAARCAAMPSTASGPTGPFGAVIGGRSLFEASAELRIKVTDTIGIVPFFDAGNAFASSFPNFSAAPLYVRRPVGLRYYTAIGPIRLDVAVPSEHRAGNGPVAVYVSIGQAF